MPQLQNSANENLPWVPAFAGMTAVMVVALALSACSSADQPVAPPATATAAPPATGAPGVRTEPVVPGRPGRVFIFAGVDTACAPLPAPELSVSKAPAKGDVSFKPGQDTSIAASAGGTCLGAKAKGTGVYYTARPGTSGPDAFTITAKLASGETMTRDFAVNISQ